MCRVPAALGLVIMVALTACAGRRIENGVYHSTKGYRVVLPSPAWVVADESRADLELRHHGGAAAMLANAECDRQAAARSRDLLARQLLIGIRDRATATQEEISLNGRRAVHRVLDGRLAGSDEPTRIEAYVMTDERCVYDFVYVAPPPSFESWRPDFLRFVESFERERAD